MTAKLPPCKHCGGLYTYRNRRAYGWACEDFDEFGKRDTLAIDYVEYSLTKRVRCCDCGKVRRDLEMSGGNVEVKR